MGELEVDYLESRLLEERERALEIIQQAAEEVSEGQRESAGELSRMPTHLADAASDTQESEMDLVNVNRESLQLGLIDEALRLLRANPESYATCERCGREIESERLEMIPWTRYCASCARAVESAVMGTDG